MCSGGINNNNGFWGVEEKQKVGMYTCPQGYCEQVSGVGGLMGVIVGFRGVIGGFNGCYRDVNGCYRGFNGCYRGLMDVIGGLMGVIGV